MCTFCKRDDGQVMRPFRATAAVDELDILLRTLGSSSTQSLLHHTPANSANGFPHSPQLAALESQVGAAFEYDVMSVMMRLLAWSQLCCAETGPRQLCNSSPAIDFTL